MNEEALADLQNAQRPLSMDEWLNEIEAIIYVVAPDAAFFEVSYGAAFCSTSHLKKQSLHVRCKFGIGVELIFAKEGDTSEFLRREFLLWCEEKVDQRIGEIVAELDRTRELYAKIVKARRQRPGV